jgi:hypothetical protein
MLSGRVAQDVQFFVECEDWKSNPVLLEEGITSLINQHHYMEVVLDTLPAGEAWNKACDVKIGLQRAIARMMVLQGRSENQ